MSINKIYRGRGQSDTPEEVGNTGGGGGAGSVSDFQVNYTISMDNTNRIVNEPIIVKAGTGDFTVSSSDSTVVTASVNNTTKVITLEGLKYGSAVITVTMAASGSYEACTKSIEVTSRCFVPVAGNSYVLGSGAHTSGSPIPEAVCLSVDRTNNIAVMQCKGLYASVWPGAGELSSAASTYFGNLAEAISDVYLPRRAVVDGNVLISVYDGNDWITEHSADVRDILYHAAIDYRLFGAGWHHAWLGTEVSTTNAYVVSYQNEFSSGGKDASIVSSPTFILDLTKVKLNGTQIVLLTAGDMPEFVAFNSTESDAVEKICDILDAADAGDIYLGDYWDVGDTREITVGAFSVHSISYPSQNMDIVITRFGDFYGSGAHFDFDFVDALNPMDRIEAARGSSRTPYNNIEVYTTTLPALVNVLPSWLKNRLKTFSVKQYHPVTGTTTTISNNKLALRAVVEVHADFAGQTANEGITIPYYNDTASHRIKGKGKGGSAVGWWTRTERYDTNTADQYEYVKSDGTNATVSFADGTTEAAISPFGCL